MTHLFAAEGVTYLKKHGNSLPECVAISTDYLCHPFWEYLECDYHILGHIDLIDQFVSRGIPRSKLRAYGIPVSAQFRQRKSKGKARTELRLPIQNPLYLIMAGSVGAGHLFALVNGLLHAGTNSIIAVICGSNERLFNNLNQRYERNSRVHVCGTVNNVADWMSACDVLFSKPGGLTSTEALVHNTPLVHTAPIPGCESANADFFAKRGMALSADTVELQIKCGRTIVEESEVLYNLQRSQSENAYPDAAENIVSLIC